MAFTFRPSLVRQVKSYASHTPVCTENTLDCSLGVNPYGFPHAVYDAIKGFDVAHLPDYPHSPVLHEALVAYWKDFAPLTEQELILANGSVCGLYILNNIFSQAQRREVVGFVPTFTDMVESVRSFAMSYHAVPARMEDNCRMAAEDLISAMSEDTALVYVDRPNNPTGQVMSLADVEKILLAARRIGCYVLVDEAYASFLPREESAMVLRGRYPELLVLRTFSKGFGLANLRCGYIAATQELCECMARTLNPYILSDLHRVICAAALSEPEHPTAHGKEFAAVKQAIVEAGGKKITTLVTDGRVPICTLRCEQDVDLQELLLAQGVLTVSGREFELLDKRCVRLRVPTTEHTEKLVKAVKNAADHM